MIALVAEIMGRILAAKASLHHVPRAIEPRAIENADMLKH
jgi:hypothetical protein